MPRLDRLAATAGRLAGTGGAILCFHGLDVDKEQSRSAMHVSHDHFAAIVEGIRRLGEVVPLWELLARHASRRSTTGLVALTADDAYASWLAAEGLLRRLAVPFTLFAVTDALADGRRFWWDRVDDAASQATPMRWRRFEDACGLPTAYRQGQPPSEGPARPMRQWLLAAHSGRWPAEFEEPMAQLESELGSATSQRSMTETELADFLDRTGAGVGVHTVTHAALPFLSDAALAAEVGDGYARLRARFPQAAPVLAIPFGLFDARTLRLAREAGMQASLTLAGTALDVSFGTDVGVPRICVVRTHAPGRLALKASRAARVMNRLWGRHLSGFPPLPSPTS